MQRANKKDKKLDKQKMWVSFAYLRSTRNHLFFFFFLFFCMSYTISSLMGPHLQKGENVESKKRVWVGANKMGKRETRMERIMTFWRQAEESIWKIKRLPFLFLITDLLTTVSQFIILFFVSPDSFCLMVVCVFICEIAIAFVCLTQQRTLIN